MTVSYYVGGVVGESYPIAIAQPGTLANARWIMARMLGLDDDENDINERVLWNYQINAACQWMDEQFEYHKQDAWVYKTLNAGHKVITLENSRNVKGVFDVRMTDDGEQHRHPIPWRQVDVGLGDDPDNETTLAMSWEETGDHWPVRAIRVAPSDEARTIAVLSAWKSVTLSLDSDKNFWTVERPMLLAKAGLREKEIAVRNLSGIQQWDAVILPELRKMSDNLHAEEARSFAPLRWRG